MQDHWAEQEGGSIPSGGASKAYGTGAAKTIAAVLYAHKDI